MRLLRTLCQRRFRQPLEPIQESHLESGIGRYTKDYANLPERYILRKSSVLKYKSENDPAFVPRICLQRPPSHNMNRPWTQSYWDENPKRGNTICEAICERDWMWFRGDRVELLTGDDKGKQGFIDFVVQERNWVTVENLNCEYVFEGSSSDYPGMMIRKEKPLNVLTDIKLVDPFDEQPCDVEWRFTESGERVRVSQRTQHILPMPKAAFATVDYKVRETYVENKNKDTPASVVEEITYNPKVCTFDMEIMQVMNIQETRWPTKTYWY